VSLNIKLSRSKNPDTCQQNKAVTQLVIPCISNYLHSQVIYYNSG
jgi:hypothetical protein